MDYATAYWCVLAAALLPYAWTVIAKGSGKHFDNRDPRGWMQRQDNPWVARANAAQMNAFEAFPAFAAAVVMAHLAGVDAGRAALLALVFVVLRVLHGVFYVADLDKLRSLAWAGGVACVLALLVSAAMAVG